jgi:hypothetical protein
VIASITLLSFHAEDVLKFGSLPCAPIGSLQQTPIRFTQSTQRGKLHTNNRRVFHNFSNKHLSCGGRVEVRIVAVRGSLQQFLHEPAPLVVLDFRALQSLRFSNTHTCTREKESR